MIKAVDCCLIIDTREKHNDETANRLTRLAKEHDFCYHQWQTLDYGDYTLDLRVKGKWMYAKDKRIYPFFAIEHKYASELAGCLCDDDRRRRLTNEFQRAQNHNANLCVLVEGSHKEFESAIETRYQRQKEQVIYLLASLSRKYGVHIYFSESYGNSIFKNPKTQRTKEEKAADVLAYLLEAEANKFYNKFYHRDYLEMMEDETRDLYP